MKSLKTFVVLVASSLTLYCNAQNPKFVVAVRNLEKVKTTLSGEWNLEIGEVYPFVRFMSSSEYEGGTGSDDSTYSVLKMDDGLVIVPSASVIVVPEKDVASAAIKYGQEVTEHRKAIKSMIPQELAQRPPPLHSRFTDPEIEKRYLEICDNLHESKGYWPTNAEIYAVLKKELDEKQLKDSINDLIDLLNR